MRPADRLPAPAIDVSVHGGGPVGRAAALALAHQGLRVALAVQPRPGGGAVERRNPEMTVAYYFVIVFHVIACLFLIGVVLLQQGKNQDLASAFGGGGTQTAFGPRGSANVLSKATTILAGLFMITCLALSMLRPKPTSALDQAGASAPAAAPSSAPGASVPGASVPPASAPAVPAPAASPSAQ